MADTITLEARFVGHEPKIATFENVTFTYIEARWSTTHGAGGDVVRNLKEPPQLDIAGLPQLDRKDGWNFIIFPGLGEAGREITGTEILPNNLIRFTLRGA